MKFYFDPVFEEPLNKLGPYWDGWQVNFYPEGPVYEIPDPTLLIEPFRNQENTFWLYNNRGFTLWSKANNLVHAKPLKDWLEGQVEALEKIVEGFSTTDNGKDIKGALTEHALEILRDLQFSMEEEISLSSLKEYWNVNDYFVDPPKKNERDASALVAEALEGGDYLDPQEVQQYLKHLEEEESREKE